MLDITKIDRDKLSPAQRERLDTLIAKREDVESERVALAAIQGDLDRAIEEAEHETAIEEHKVQRARAEEEGAAAMRREAKKLGLHLVCKVDTCHGPIVLRCPPAKEAAALHERTSALIEAGSEQDANELAEEFLRDKVLVFPAFDEYQRIAGEHPAIATTIAEKINEMLLGRTEIAGKGAAS